MTKPAAHQPVVPTGAEGRQFISTALGAERLDEALADLALWAEPALIASICQPADPNEGRANRPSLPTDR